MTTMVTGTFNSRAEANRAVSELMQAGFNQSEISLVMSDEARQRTFSDNEGSGNEAAEGGLTGAAFGGALGAILAGLTAVGSFAVPGAGLLVAGPIVAALSGAGAGAAVGGVTGALIGAGFSDDEAEDYEADIRAGRAIIVVHADGNRADTARSILKNANANVTRAA